MLEFVIFLWTVLSEPLATFIPAKVISPARLFMEYSGMKIFCGRYFAPLQSCVLAVIAQNQSFRIVRNVYYKFKNITKTETFIL